MTLKEVIEKNYECFNTGDMETFVSLYHEDVVVTIIWYAQILRCS